MLAAKIYNDKEVKSYMRSQLKSIKHSQELLTSEDILNDIKANVSERHNVIFSNTTGFVVKFDKKTDPEIIIEDIISVMETHYKEFNINLLFKFFVIENELVVQKKR